VAKRFAVAVSTVVRVPHNAVWTFLRREGLRFKKDAVRSRAGGRWRTMIFLAALGYDGLAAPCVFDGPLNG
jgi:hypothetical protein